MIRAAALALVLLAGGCSVREYCLDCAEDDAGDDDGGGDGDGGGIDAGPPADACISSGVEVCDGLDNDCNGQVDDGDLPEVGDPCGTDTGPCVAGVRACVDGEMVCQGEVTGAPEVCDGEDNDCDGVDDNGDPGGGTLCGTDTGECVSGVNHCSGGVVECQGDVGPSAEVCDGLDNDCDSDDPVNGGFDEGIATMGDCGPSQGNTGECQLGVMTCIGGVFQCMGAIYPQLEKCDGSPDTTDWDCDGNPLNGFDLSNDVRNCGACGNSCLDDHAPADHVAAVFCQASTCRISQCQADYWNNDNAYANGCEYFCNTFSGPQEACNGKDDDCDGDVDPPAELIHPQVCVGPICRDVCDISGTPCAGTTSECANGAWTCNWPAGVNNPDGDTLPNPESDCDDFDDDCDGIADDTFEPQKGDSCNDGGVGICGRTGTLACNSTHDGLVCGNLSPPSAPTTETCNGKDDNCDGVTDEGFTSGGAPAAAWVNIGGGVSIFAYEASRPDASDTSAGTLQTHVCSKPDALPWTTITYDAALATCQSIGARLCAEAEWERACQGLQLRYQGDGSASNVISMQAEDYHRKFTSSCCGGDWWAPLAVPGYTGVTAMMIYDDDGSSPNDTTGARMEYDVTFPVAGTYYVWIRGWAFDANSDSVHAGLDGALQANSDQIRNFTAGAWLWLSTVDATATRATFTVATAGNHVFDIYEDDDGFVIDKIVLTTSAAYNPAGVNAGVGPKAGCGWSYATDCETYQPATCNGEDFDTDALVAGDQDELLPGGTLGTCYSDWGAAGQIFDLSGNVKEFTDDRSNGVNPVRGGASNNTAAGISCTNDFTVVDDGFAFPNTGFRCCK